MNRQSPLINVMKRAADKAARGLKRDFGEVENLQVSRKGPADFVSTADLKAEQVLHTELSRARPRFGFLMEESGAKGSDASAPQRWIVDPLDGTTNFLHGLPHFAISIALEDRGEITAGVIYDPVKDEMFWAEKGVGAFLVSGSQKDRRLRVSSRGRTEDCILATGIPFVGHGDQEKFVNELNVVMGNTAGVRRWGAASLDLAYVAAGRFDGFWERGLQPWDIAAGLLIVKEAGGYVSTIEGGTAQLDSGSILAANDQLHPRMVKLISGK